MWPMYTSMNLFTGCFLLNGIVQYILVVCPTVIPDSWNDKHVAWGSTSIVWIIFICASGIMHYNGNLPPSYYALRGIEHDLSEHVSITLRRTIIISSFTAICILRIIISLNPRRHFRNFFKRFDFLRTCCCNNKGNDDDRIEDTCSFHETTDVENERSQSSNQVLSNGTFFVWSLSWFTGMSLRWTYGDEDLLIGDICSIFIFYVYPIAIVFSHTNIKRFVKRRLVFFYHRFMQELFGCILVTKYCCALGCLRERQQEDQEPCITEHEANSVQWAVRTTEPSIESVEIKSIYYIDTESINSRRADLNGCCIVESME